MYPKAVIFETNERTVDNPKWVKRPGILMSLDLIAAASLDNSYANTYTVGSSVRIIDDMIPKSEFDLEHARLMKADEELRKINEQLRSDYEALLKCHDETHAENERLLEQVKVNRAPVSLRDLMGGDMKDFRVEFK